MRKDGIIALAGACFAMCMMAQPAFAAGPVTVSGDALSAIGTSQENKSTRSGDGLTNDSEKTGETDKSDPSSPTSNTADTPTSDAAASASTQNGWSEQGSERYWYDNGVMARSKEVYDPASNAWYWFDADGTMARNKDVYLPSNGGKWVRYDQNGHMRKGEDRRYNAWYYFDPTTGAMAKGFVYLPSRKWVYYDLVTGRMQYGQKRIDNGWYYLDPVSGAVHYGWQYLKDDAKWALYDWPSGRMVYGFHTVNGRTYYFDPATGAFDASRSPNSLPSSVIAPQAGAFGHNIVSGRYKSIRVLGDSIAAGMGAQPDYWTESTPLFSINGTQYYEPAHGIDSAYNKLRATLKQYKVSMMNASVPQLGSMKTFLGLGTQTFGKEDAAIVMLGTNDRIQSSSLDEFRTNAEAYLEAVSNHYNGNMVVLSEPPVSRETEVFSTADINAVLSQICARHGWQFASMYDAFNQMSVAYGVPLDALFQDSVHPNHLGQQAMWSALSQLLGL